GAQVEAAAKPVPVAGKINEVEVQLALQVRVGLRVPGYDKARTVGRPVKPRDVPRTVGQLRNASAERRHYEEVVVSTIDETLAVVLVIKASRNPRDRRAAQLISALGQARVVHHGV